MKNKVSVKIISILLLLISTFIIGIFISLNSLQKLRDDATSINNIGYIRGSIQRLAHVDNPLEQEKILQEIQTKFKELKKHFLHDNEAYLDISDFNNKFQELQACWEVIEGNHLNKGPLLCKSSWKIADRTARAATEIAHVKYDEIVVTIVSIGSIILLLLILALLLIHFEVRNYLEINILKDPLTELYNRNHLLEQLSSTISSFHRLKQPFSLIFIDLDHFKYINDTYGHQTGDRILKDFSCILSSVLRGEDLPFRYGGEEFLILAKHANEEDAYLLAERIRKKVKEHDFNIGYTITISLGISEFGQLDTIDTILSHADSAMYQAKDQGRNQSCIYKA